MMRNINQSALYGQLFDSDSAYLPRPFQGEALYSWCARFHRLNGNPSARLTCRQLFSDSVAGFRHDFPTHLEIFSENTNHLLGPVDALIQDRTVFAIFSPFLPKTITDAVIHNMRTGGPARIKYHLGILASRTGTAAPLKACPSCMRSDMTSAVVAWWHVAHQWPTVWVCPEHGDYLLTATQEFHARRLKDWFLPTDLLPIHWHGQIKLNETAIGRLRKLCDWSFRLSKRYNNPFDSELLRFTYHLRAKSMGWTSMDGSLKFSHIRQAFRDAYKCLEDLPGFSFLRETSQDHGGFIGILLRQFVGNKHPLKHVMMMDFLFGDPDVFIAEYERVFSGARLQGKKELWAELTDSRNHLKLLVSEAGYSINSAAMQLGLPVGQAVRFIKQEGIEYKRRPRVLNLEKETTLRQLLESGEDREVIASTLQVKKSFIKDYLQKNAELRDAWQKAHQKRLLEKYRSHYLHILNDHPDLTVKQMKQISGNGIQWLLRHDKEWLGMHLPGLWRKN